MNNVSTLKGTIGHIETINGAKGPFTTIALYVSESRGKDAEGNKQYKESRFDLVAFNGVRDAIAEAGLKVGDFVEFSGALELRDRTIGDTNVKVPQVRIRKHKLLKAAGEKTEGEAA
jgi:hypothetical protein